MTTTAPAPPSRVGVQAQLRRVAAKRERRLAEVAEVDLELRQLVQQGFDEGIPGPELAAAAGVSVPRIYQIRDGRR